MTGDKITVDKMNRGKTIEDIRLKRNDWRQND
jgi:hypothetical protein